MSQSRRRKAPTIVLLAVVLAAAAAAAWFVAPRLAGTTSEAGPAGSSQSGSTDSAGTTSGSSPVAATTTPAPYTIKPEPSVVATDTPHSTVAGRADVSLTYVTFDQASRTVQASGFVAGLIEDGGTCTLTLTKGSDVVTATSKGTADATTTSCGLLQTPTGVAAGTWTAVLAYSSARATGHSSAQEVTVR